MKCVCVGVLIVTKKYKIMLLFIYVCLLSTTSGVSSTQQVSGCGENGDCLTIQNCDKKCGCDTSSLVLFYNETVGECVVSVKKLLDSLSEKYNTQENIHLEVNRVFQGVAVSVLLFVTCAGLCFITACIYCCRINYTDRRLQSDVEALSSKLKREYRLKSIKKAKTPPVAQSCNMMVADADVYVV